MPKQLTEDEVERFHGDGILFPIRVFGEDEIGDTSRRLEALESKRAGRLPPAMNVKPHLLVPWLWHMVHDSRILDPVEDLLGPDILCLGSSLIAKQAGDSRYVAWHQDATYWGLSSPEAVTAWVALTPSTRENGCVRVVPGSHREQLPHVDTRLVDNMLGRGEELAVQVDKGRAVDVVLAAGEMSLHHVLAVHGSEPNSANIRRIGFAIRYIPGHVRQVVGRNHYATLARGRHHGNFHLEKEPEDEFHPAAVARHRSIVKAGMAVIFAGARSAAASLPAGASCDEDI